MIRSTELKVDVTKKPRSEERGFSGAGNVTRTRDLLITSEMLYLLSYSSGFTAFPLY